uniref:G-type lectin S-receptor-like serine/threonine-protein kinase At4g27290 isoform X2 n=1 Tax=Erigeron canadensis TaxID=72917 RepID=UPI001CB8C5D7|nr:G-type lectin S-receptor-like serine/threonine-protein kinase At4g27290 isoform X2 [Erigeron canadensis]
MRILMKRKIIIEEATLLILLLMLRHIAQTYSAEINIISDSQFLGEEDKLVSPGRTFELGFFRPNGTENKYLGIWYTKVSVQTVVWVANRDRPLTVGSLGVVKIVNPGNLVIMNNNTDHIMWSSNTYSYGNTVAKLLDSGNLVLTNGNNNKIIWMSFDYPTDTFLPGMTFGGTFLPGLTFGKNFLTGKEWYLTSWKNSKDPAPGEFTWSTDTRGYPQHVLKLGEVVKYVGGPWNGEWFSGSRYKQNTIFTYNMVINKTEVAFTYNLVNNSVLLRSTLNSSGKFECSVWVEELKTWQLIFALPKDICDTYNICGAYGRCIVMSLQTCLCFDEKKFIPRDPKNWETTEWQGGCVRRTPLDCKTDGFRRYSNVKLPNTQTSWFNMSMSLKECEAMCLKNCTCMAYANTDIRGKGTGCLLWFNDLIDIKLVPEGMGGQYIFIRMASSDLDKGGLNIKIILIVVLLAILVLSLSSGWFCYTWRKKDNLEPKGESLQVHESKRETMELPLFSFSTIEKATASFSLYNKLGQGGFGPVYKGILEGGEIAVKRLSSTSSQGLDEFKNEVICISKLQHRNLVKLLGCSIEGEEKLLVYEYMPNRSLDLFIFDKTRSTLLDWTTRFHIIEGIARGLVYLHQDSRLRIIHRDLKASNILLDLDMNPKISDFGIARSFGGNENEANTEKVVGTYGYMSPEYALDGVFSTKSDVFSFGVLVLETISGKRNRGFIHSSHSNNLIGHAWTMYNEGRSLELVDTNLEETINPSEVLRSIEVGLLCVQQSPNDRPNMSSVVRMLGNELGAIQKPKQPAFFTERNILGADSSSSTNATSSTSYITVTEVVGR